MAEDGYIPVDAADARDAVPEASTPSATSPPSALPKAGVFAEGAGARRRRRPARRDRAAQSRPRPTTARGSCYIEFGAGRVGRVDVDFFSGPKPTGTFQEPSQELVAEKKQFGSSRRARWFGLD